MTACPDLDASNGEAPYGPALWEGHASLGGILATAIPAIITLGLFIGFFLGGTLTMADVQTHGMRVQQANGQWVALDGTPGRFANLMEYLPYFAIPGLLLLAALVPILRYRRRRYRIDGQAVEMIADGVTDGIAIADIRRVLPNWLGAWHLVRVFGTGGQRIDMLLGTRDAMYALAALRRLGAKTGKIDAVEAPAENPELAPGEPVRWRGRPGFGSFDAARAIALIGVFLPFTFLVIALVMIWSSDPYPMIGLFWTAFVFNLFGYLALSVLFLFSGRLRVWLLDMFGVVMVTDRRIAWRAPFSGLIYRDLAFAELVDAGVVERKGRRAWVTLTVRNGDDVRSEDLHGLPDADRFLAVLRIPA